MRAACPAQAQARLPHAAPAPPRPTRRAEALALAPIASLSAIPAKPAVQPKCAACESEELPVQPRLEVGPAGDRYEREADTIAARVMAMREADVAAVAPRVHRTCATCGAEEPRAAGVEKVSEDEARARRQLDAEDDDAQARRQVDAEEDDEAQARRQVDAEEAEEDEVRARRQVDAEEDDEAQARRQADAEEDEVQARPGADPATETGLAASAADLTSGGAPLPEGTRRFYEPRLGRDLSGVRLHRGTSSNDLNSSISARAFTYQNHIWLGRNEGSRPSFTMAHELAHVMQQTAPGPVGPAGDAAGARKDAEIRRKPAKIFAGKPYWTSQNLEKLTKGKSGTKIHEELLPLFQKANPDLLIEAPIPLSLASKSGKSRTGEADLYKGTDAAGQTRTIGVNFKKPLTPSKINWTVTQPHHSPAYSHSTSARPFLRGTKIEELDEAPTSILLGELKPNEVKKGAKQLARYEAALNRTQQRADAYNNEQNKTAATPQLGWPSLSIGKLSIAPPSLTGATGQSFGRHQLEVNQFAGYNEGKKFAIGTLVHRPPTPVVGELQVKKHTDGIYYYWWQPDPTSKATTTPPDIASLIPLTSKMMTALKTNRRVVLPRRIGASAAPGPAVRRAPSKNAEPFPNQFDKAAEAKWVTKQKEVESKFKTPTGTDLLTDHYLMEIDDSLDSGDRQGIAAKFEAGKAAAARRVRDFRDARLIAQPFAPLMAKARRLLGGVFAKGSELYAGIKERFAARSQPKTTVSGGGLPGALLRAALKVLLFIGRRIVAETMIKLTERLKGCLEKLFESWFQSDAIDEVEARVENVGAVLEGEIQAFIDATPAQQIEELFGEYGKKVDDVRDFIEQGAKAAGPFLTAYKIVKWGIQALACASPPLVGCLWGLARSAIEWAASKLIQTCWFMKKIAGAVLGIDEVRDFMESTSSTLSSSILTTAAGLFPAPVGPFLAECGTDAPSIDKPANDAICEEEPGGMGNSPKPSDQAIKFWQRWEDLPFAKQMAIKKMLGRKNAEGGTKVDWDKMEAMLDWAEKTDLATIEAAATSAAAGDATAIPAPVAAVKAAAEAAKVAEAERKAGGGAAGGGTPGGGSTENRYAREVKRPAEAGSTAQDLDAHGFTPDVYKETYQRGEEIKGTVWMIWTKPSGERVWRLVRNVWMIYQDKSTRTVGGEEKASLLLKPRDKKAYTFEGGPDSFWLSEDSPINLVHFKPRGS